MAKAVMNMFAPRASQANRYRGPVRRRFSLHAERGRRTLGQEIRRAAVRFFPFAMRSAWNLR